MIVTSRGAERFSISSNKGMLPAAGIPVLLDKTWRGDELLFLTGNPELCLGDIFNEGL